MPCSRIVAPRADMQIEKQTDPAKTGLVRCLVSKSHGSEVCNCCVQRFFFLSRQDHEIAACRSFATKKNPLAPRVKEPAILISTLLLQTHAPQLYSLAHSRPQRPRSFWSAPRIATSGLVQRLSVFEWLCKHNRLRLEPIRFVKLDSEHAQSDGKSVNRGLPVLDFARGRDSWCWPKGARSLGTRMSLGLTRLLKSWVCHHECMECKECYFLTRITRNIWTLDHVKVMHSSCADQSKSSVSTWIRPFCSCCRIVCHFPAVFRLKREWQLFVCGASATFEPFSFSKMAQNVTQYCHVCKHKERLGRLWSSFSPLSAQLSCQSVTYFGLFMKYRHSFATMLPQFYHWTTLFTTK